MDALFDCYKGPKQSESGADEIVYFEDNEHGAKRIKLNNSFNVTAGRVTHWVDLCIYAKDDIDKDGKGIRSLEFATKKQ
jgi:hypothetical protein